jgi:flagellar hook-associated protein 3 FlgL
VKSDLARLAQELASGQKADISTSGSGDFGPIIGLERSLKANQAYQTAATEAGLFATSMQASLEQVQNYAAELAPSLLMAGSSQSELVIGINTEDAKSKFDAVISALNTRVADRYAFSGASTDRPALSDANTMLADLQIAIAAETTAVGVVAAADLWFDIPAGGFNTIAYIGSNSPMAPFGLSDNDTVDLGLTAAEPGIRATLKAFGLAVLIGEGALAPNTDERAALATITGENMLSGDYDLTIVRARVGSGEARIDDAGARNEAEKYSLEIARNEITAVDAYQTATELEALTGQLETLYTLTVRLSRLSLSEYLR